jgi:hypothetical protein
MTYTEQRYHVYTLHIPQLIFVCHIPAIYTSKSSGVRILVQLQSLMVLCKVGVIQNRLHVMDVT